MFILVSSSIVSISCKKWVIIIYLELDQHHHLQFNLEQMNFYASTNIDSFNFLCQRYLAIVIILRLAADVRTMVQQLLNGPIFNYMSGATIISSIQLINLVLFWKSYLTYEMQHAIKISAMLCINMCLNQCYFEIWHKCDDCHQ